MLSQTIGRMTGREEMASKQKFLSGLISMLGVTYWANCAIAAPIDEPQAAQFSEIQSASDNQTNSDKSTETLNPVVGPNSKAATKTAIASAPSKSKVKSTASLPKKAFGFVIGTLVGVPVCMVRNPVSEEKWSVDNWTGDNKDKPRVAIPAGIAYSPFALVDGILLSPFSSLKHSWQNFDEPFSKEQFSLGQIPKQGDEPITPTSNTDH
jgi:hypothetical protein